jgi:hypothetical protein
MNLCFAGGMCLQSSHGKRVACKVLSANGLRPGKPAISAGEQRKEARRGRRASLSSLYYLYYTRWRETVMPGIFSMEVVGAVRVMGILEGRGT